MNDTRGLCLKQTKVTILPKKSPMKIRRSHLMFKEKSLLLFLTFSILVANPKKLLYTVANLARGLLNWEKRTKEKVWQHTPHTARSENETSGNTTYYIIYYI